MQLTNISDDIFSLGDKSTAVYVIEHGEVALIVDDGIEVARLHAGELLGEAGVLENELVRPPRPPCSGRGC
jgi:CRP-like cAMP-binding protein